MLQRNMQFKNYINTIPHSRHFLYSFFPFLLLTYSHNIIVQDQTMSKYINDIYIPKCRIDFIVCKLGESMVYSMKGSKRKTWLTSVSIAARDAICATVSDRSIWDWCHFFLEFGYIPTESRVLRRKYKKRRRRYTTFWIETRVILFGWWMVESVYYL